MGDLLPDHVVTTATTPPLPITLEPEKQRPTHEEEQNQEDWLRPEEVEPLPDAPPEEDHEANTSPDQPDRKEPGKEEENLDDLGAGLAALAAEPEAPYQDRVGAHLRPVIRDSVVLRVPAEMLFGLPDLI